MTQEEKELLIKDLCARLPYGVICYYDTSDKSETMLGRLSSNILESFISNKPLIGEENQCKIYDYSVTTIKPYLRPMSSMTEEEEKEYERLANRTIVNSVGFVYFDATELLDWFNKKMFDFRGLIPKGLVLSTEEYNPYKD